MSSHLQRANKVLDRINELASFSDDKNCIARTYGTRAFIDGRNKLRQWMEEAGLQTSIDTIGNLRG
ncbi:MAG TPA: Zn-dependent hydrolase, partial [Chitinophagaceae bacterium]|nr:Zn-dependent hydrolase [Chitinophagaceae bacterium]